MHLDLMCAFQTSVSKGLKHTLVSCDLTLDMSEQLHCIFFLFETVSQPSYWNI